MNINYLGSVRATKIALPYLIKKFNQPESRIIYVSSLAGLVGIYGYSCYSPTKFAIRGLAETLSMEFLSKNIRISVCVPPDTDTESFAIENLTKPDITQTISKGAGIFTPKKVANSIIYGLYNYKYFITTGFESYLLASIISGFSPATYLDALFQIFLLSPLRIVTIWYLNCYNTIVNSFYNSKESISK